MDYEDRFTYGWDCKQDGSRVNDKWAEYGMADEDATLKNMGHQEDLFPTTMTSPNHTKGEPHLVPGLPRHNDGLLIYGTYDIFGSSILAPDTNSLDLLGLHALNEPGLESFATEPGTTQSFDASASHEPTPSLTMSPYTTFASDFGSFMADNDNQLSESKFSDEDRSQSNTRESDLKRQHTPKASKPTAKSRSKGVSADRTSISHSFECRDCSKHFPRRCDLRKHERAVHISQGNRPHACSYCDKRFIWPKDIKRHEERVHGKAVAARNAQVSTDQEEGTGSREDLFDLKMPDVPETDFELFSQDWLCSTNNPAQHTFSRTHFPGEGSAPHRGARV